MLPDVRHLDGQLDVLYVATDQGDVLKLINLANLSGNNAQPSSSGAHSGEDSLLAVGRIQLSTAPVRRLLVSAEANCLVVVTDPVVYRLPLHFCGLHSRCSDCVGSRDPHCVWEAGKCVGIER